MSQHSVGELDQTREQYVVQPGVCGLGGCPNNGVCVEPHITRQDDWLEADNLVEIRPPNNSVLPNWIRQIERHETSGLACNCERKLGRRCVGRITKRCFRYRTIKVY